MITYAPQARKFIKKAETSLAQRLLARIERLEKEQYPQECETIKGDGSFRVRVGDYRIVYDPGEPLHIIRIDKRETVY